MIQVELNAEVQCISQKWKIMCAKLMGLRMSLMCYFMFVKHLFLVRFPLDGPKYLSQQDGEKKLCLYINSLCINQAKGNHTVGECAVETSV